MSINGLFYENIIYVLAVMYSIGDMMLPHSEKRVDAVISQLYPRALQLCYGKTSFDYVIQDNTVELLCSIIKSNGKTMAEAVFKELQRKLSQFEVCDISDPKLSLCSLYEFFDNTEGVSCHSYNDIKAATMFYIYYHSLIPTVLVSYTDEPEIKDIFYKSFCEGNDGEDYAP
jgi:hypothetical protein